MLQFLRIIHKTAGIVGAILIIFIAITGLLLNHRSVIGFDSDKKMELQKLIFALHSGVIGNISIVWLTDLGAICMIILSITGIWMWFKGQHAAKYGKRRNH